MKSLIKSFLTDNEGNFAVMTAVMAPVLLAFIALAVDTTNFFKQKRDLSDAADVALIFGAKKYEEMRKFGNTKSQAARGAMIIANQAFNDQNKDEYARVTRDISYTETNGVITGNIEYKYDSPFFFQGFISKNERQSITDKSQIVLGGGEEEDEYLDLTLVIDNSASMGVGASAADQRTMHAATGCTFACHVPRSTYQLENLPSEARKAGAELRLDALKDAAMDGLKELRKENPGSKNIRVSVYTFSNYFQTVTKPTTKLNRAINDIRKIDFADETNTPENVFGGTNLDFTMKQLNKTLEDRKKVDRRRNEVERNSYILLFTDGIENDTYQKHNGEELYSNALLGPSGDSIRDLYLRLGLQDRVPHFFETIPGSKRYTLVYGDPNWVEQADKIDSTQVFDPDICNPIKANGHTIVAIQTFYDVTPELKSHSFSIAPGSFIETRQPEIESKFKTCASGEENYYLTRDADDLTEKLTQALFSTLGGEEEFRLTQ